MLTQRFDGSGRGELSDREAFNVLKMQHKVNISQEKVNIQFWVSLFGTNNFNANYIFKVFAILAHIPRTSNGKMRIDEFINLPILSEEAFNAIDRFVDTKRNWMVLEGSCSLNVIQSAIRYQL